MAPPYQRIVILTGAGISKESGLDTFRDADGIWNKVRLEDVATPEAFARDPAGVQAFYNARRRSLCSGSVVPNLAHRVLAEFERRHAGAFLLVTQNIDDLHDRAGSRNLLHMHGELLKARCTACDAVHDWRDDIEVTTVSPCCNAVGRLRPHVVWFGEMPLAMEQIYEALAACDLFIAIGTSGTVHPAAGFVYEAILAGAHTVELNLEPSEGKTLFAEQAYGPATSVVPAYIARMFSGA